MSVSDWELETGRQLRFRIGRFLPDGNSSGQNTGADARPS